MKEIHKTEYWKPIAETNYEYWISSKGRVASVMFKNGVCEFMRIKYLTPTDNGNGYLTFMYPIGNGKRKVLYIHRLVAKYFIGEVEGKPYVNHIDYNTRNNNVSNLEWCTAKENARHSIEHYRKPKNVCMSNTGYKYITLTKNNTYRVEIATLGISKRKKTLEDALAYRKEVLGDKYELYIADK